MERYIILSYIATMVPVVNVKITFRQSHGDLMSTMLGHPINELSFGQTTTKSSDMAFSMVCCS